MRVLFLTLYPELAASPRYRVAQFVPYLEGRSVRCTVASALTNDEWKTLTGPQRTRRAFWYHYAETRHRIAQILNAGHYDIVFVQKAIMTAYLRGMLGLLRKRARKIVYDLDDAVHLASPHPLRGVWRALEDPNQTKALMGAADLVLAGNRWLVEEAKPYAARVEHFPTVVDTNRFVPSDSTPAEYRLGWIGTPSNMVCVKPAAEALAEVDARLTFVGADPKDVPWANAEVRPWAFETEVSEIQRFSVGIMPMPDTPWMRGKCALKVLLYMACGVPCVASPFGAALDIISDHENGLFAADTAGWLGAFERLRDSAERARLGAAGRATVEERYSVKSAAPRLYALLESVA